MTEPAQTQRMDGRRARSERSKRAIIDACQSLMLDGNLVPTAQMISDAAGVPIRTFFRHFPDMESLFFAVDESLKPSYSKLFEKPALQGSLSARIKDAIKLRVESYEDNRAVIEATKAQLWRYRLLQDNYARATKGLRQDLEVRLPELREIGRDVREAIHATASIEMWSRLRHQQQLSRKRSTRIMRQSIELMLGQTLKEVDGD